MKNRIQSIPIDKLIAHPENPNRMSKAALAKLVRNIERTGNYEPLVVRPNGEYFQIINGHHRLKALEKLGLKSIDAVVWDVDETQTRILVGSLNRLSGSDVLNKKVQLLKRLRKQMQADELAKVLPHTTRQIERLSAMSVRPPQVNFRRSATRHVGSNPIVFFLNDQQSKEVEKAMSLATTGCSEKTKAAINAAALTHIAHSFIDGRYKTDEK